MPITVLDDDDPIHVAVGIVANQSGEVLVAKRPAGSHQGGLWEFPGGKLEPGEGVLTALKRELQEEVGIQIREASRLIQVPHRYPDRQVLLDTWRVQRWQGQPVGREGQQLAWVDPRQLDGDTFPAADKPIINALRLPLLYLISPEPREDIKGFMRTLECCLDAGVRLFQLRAKRLSGSGYAGLATAVSALCERYSADLILNAAPIQALRYGAGGVHLTSARLLQLTERPLDGRYWVAASCHNAVEIEHAARIGVDFIVLGPVLPTGSHPSAQPMGWDGFRQHATKAPMPVFALGGLGSEHGSVARRAGAQGVALISGVWNAADPSSVVLCCTAT